MRWPPPISPSWCCTWNRADLLRRCLDSIVPQLGDDDELVVVDNGSTDHTPATLAAIDRARVIRLPANLGCPRGRNAGMAAVRGRWVFCVDDDGWLPPGALDRARRSIARHPAAAIIAGGVVTDPGLAPAPGDLTPSFRFSGGIAVLRRDWFERCGGYPVDGHRQGEEQDLAFRIYDAGGHVLRDPALVLVHAADASADHARVVVRNNVRQDLTTVLRYYPVRALGPVAASKLARYAHAGLPAPRRRPGAGRRARRVG